MNKRSRLWATLLTSLLLLARPLAAPAATTVSREQAAAQGIYLPYRVENPKTPETRTLTEAEAAAAIEHDWLFQAMGETLLQRAAKEIGWARELARRLTRGDRAPDLSVELAELDALEKRLGEMPGKSTAAPLARSGGASPSWIWFPEGRATEDAPAEARFFRRAFEVPEAGVRRAELRIAADDACEVFLNGARIGANDTWREAAAFAVEKQVKRVQVGRLRGGLLSPLHHPVEKDGENRDDQSRDQIMHHHSASIGSVDSAGSSSSSMLAFRSRLSSSRIFLSSFWIFRI